MSTELRGEELSLAGHRTLHVHQRHEIGELMGFEGRNKYEVLDSDGRAIAFAAEQQKGILGFLLRQFLGHWRRFEIHFFTMARVACMVARHPFRWFFQRLELFDMQGAFLGAVQQRFSLLSKRFDIVNAAGQTLMEVASPLWKLWTFPFVSNGRQVACVKKKWSGLLAETFTDKDNFAVEFEDDSLTEEERRLVLAAALFIDLQYFERKARS